MDFDETTRLWSQTCLVRRIDPCQGLSFAIKNEWLTLMLNEPPPTYAIFTVTEVLFKGNLIDHVIADISYPRISITHTWKVSRTDVINFLKSQDHFLFQEKRWKLITVQGIEMIDFEVENQDQ